MAGKQALSAGNWIAIAGLVLAVLGAGGALSMKVYASKSDCEGNAHKLETRIVIAEQQNQYQTQEIQRLGTRTENMAVQQQTDSKNIEKLLERFRVEPEPRPTMRPVPKPAPPPPPVPAQ